MSCYSLAYMDSVRSSKNQSRSYSIYKNPHGTPLREKRIGIVSPPSSDVALTATPSQPTMSPPFTKIVNFVAISLLAILSLSVGIVTNKVISSNSTALDVTPSTFWLLDSTCCNHMMSNISLLSSPIPVHSLPPIYSTDGSGSANRVDNAMDYKDSQLLSFLVQQGTLIQCSCPHTSEQNGRAKRKYQKILEFVRAQLLFASYPEKFWEEVVLTSIYVINCLPSQVIHNVRAQLF
ncbi:Retrovirus-related Pol polyprotein from transposon TNT 1-94 [Cucumis melo var. makuwa]|uniref:Retrovirus-related Pol polyprotein from transposon TNT 1-94 n=1 Tax=Cucumis melo var. makuwa TaxID=1194695 RepID=A0A5D3CI54_CUCMM|nr:Retrovirus-related Pol polyprotein from transposon TNT 1-94 [Cucumis melo var. makuwa]